MNACHPTCDLRHRLVHRLILATEEVDDARYGQQRCTRRLWGDSVGLLCSREDYHTPGPSQCQYIGSAMVEGLPLRV